MTGGVWSAYGFYDPGPQRWLNRDPVGEIGGMNLYAFVSNEPVGTTDDLGLWSDETMCHRLCRCTVQCTLGSVPRTGNPGSRIPGGGVILLPTGGIPLPGPWTHWTFTATYNCVDCNGNQSTDTRTAGAWSSRPTGPSNPRSLFPNTYSFTIYVPCPGS